MAIRSLNIFENHFWCSIWYCLYLELVIKDCPQIIKFDHIPEVDQLESVNACEIPYNACVVAMHSEERSECYHA